MQSIFGSDHLLGIMKLGLLPVLGRFSSNHIWLRIQTNLEGEICIQCIRHWTCILTRFVTSIVSAYDHSVGMRQHSSPSH